MKISCPILLLSGVLLIGQPSDHEISFSSFEINLGPEKHPSFHTGDLAGDAHKEIVILTRTESKKNQLFIYSFVKNSWVKTLKTELPNGLKFADIANIAGRDRVIFYHDNVFSYFDFETENHEELFFHNFGYSGKLKNRIPKVKMTKDLTNDGLDEFIIPEQDGFSVWVQKNDGSFHDPVKMEAPEPFLHASAFDGKRNYGEVGVNAQTIPWYLSRVHFFDANLDGWKDLVFWNQDHFDVFRQNEQGLFEPIASPFATDVHFDSDGIYSFLFSYSGESAFGLVTGLRKKSTYTVLRSIEDLNGDGIADLLTHQLSGRSVIKQESLYKAHFGTATKDRVAFSDEQTTQILPRGTAGGLQHSGYSNIWIKDLNGDSNLDILRYDAKIGITGAVRMFLTQTLYIEIEAFSITNEPLSEKSSIKKRIKTEFDIYDGKDGMYFPFVITGDVNGDEKIDLLVGRTRKELNIFFGGNSPNLIADDPQIMTIDLPHQENHVWLTDLNNDNKDDILIIDQNEDSPNILKTLIKL